MDELSIERDLKDLQDVLNFSLQPHEQFDNKIGLELSTLKISLTNDDPFLETIDYGAVDENSPDFIWIGLLQMACGQHMKIMAEGNYFVENMYY